MNRHRFTIGWDIGGANLKAVLVDHVGHVIDAIQYPCPLWMGMHHLRDGIKYVLQRWGGSHHHAITMTGELVDLFANRHEGVCQISQELTHQLGTDIHFYASLYGFVNVDTVEKHSASIASMNWHASVKWVAQHVNQGLFLDMGTTTTDIIEFNRGQVCSQGMTDAQRMSADELVYTGVVRTPLMAIAHKVLFSGKLYHVAAEYFATMADVYRLLGELPEEVDIWAAADGKDKSISASASRLARMIGYDEADATMDEWHRLAQQFKQHQVKRLEDALRPRVDTYEEIPQIVGAGCGSFVIKELAERMVADYIDVETLIPTKDKSKSAMTKICFPAFAVASLLVHAQ